VAELQIEGDELVLHASRGEKLEAVHSDLRAPLAAIRSIGVLNDTHEPADHGFEVGERLPCISEAASVRTGGERIFAVVHHDTPRGVRVVFEGTDHGAWIVGAANPEKVAADLESKAGAKR
jgi:hypothetical protein